ncbi:hypothetical protein [Variovorax sp. Root411]|uniref:hypothetical protein n=1 Tax=Variovorax sp. Root411 TaxID=1736530 RepID=UPI0012F9ACB6|nr:hypothetical protein [Variovorax sp. Root411]
MEFLCLLLIQETATDIAASPLLLDIACKQIHFLAKGQEGPKSTPYLDLTQIQQHDSRAETSLEPQIHPSDPQPFLFPQEDVTNLGSESFQKKILSYQEARQVFFSEGKKISPLAPPLN